MFALSPASENSEPGKEYPFNPNGQCIFYKDEKCSIHAAKPFECKRYDHNLNEDKEETRIVHRAVAEAWFPHQDKITQLLGREPEVLSNPLEMMQFFLNKI